MPVEPSDKHIDNNVAVFVYVKNDEAKVLNVSQARDQHDYLIRSKWKHVGTLEPVIWIECLLNEPKALKMINDLKNGG